MTFRIGDRVRILLAVPCLVPKSRIGTTARVVRIAGTGVVYLEAKGLKIPMRVPKDAAAVCLEHLP